MKRPALVIHGHFYQPPRENPWTNAVDPEPSASPFRDWNERIFHECYRANAAAPILDANASVLRVINNYEFLSFNFGPTLLSWIEREHPEIHAAIVRADHASLTARGGHGNAIAQGYNHAILPLSTERDRNTQIRWGLADFKYRFGRDAESMWLPETACNDATLEALIEHGMRYVILAPRQAKRIRELDGDGEWRVVTDTSIDCTMPYRWSSKRSPKKSIAIFFYDGALSQSIAFERSLASSETLVTRLRSAAHTNDSVVHVATDGETYGHHFHHGERGLAYAFDVEVAKHDFWCTNYGEFLDHVSPTYEVEIDHGEDGEGSSWSCAHGVGRWKRDCGCHTGGRDNWNQTWRAPVRAAFDIVRIAADQFFEEAGAKYLRDVWAARDASIALRLGGAQAREQFEAAHATRAFDDKARAEVDRLLNIQYFTQLMYTSCGWFFSDPSGIETTQVLRYALRTLELLDEAGADAPLADFIAQLATARSNVPGMGTVADLLWTEVDIAPRRKQLTAAAPHFLELDRHLFSEGRHERLWDKLGAHTCTMNGHDGVMFSVWAPNARRVSVVGDFNAWNRDAHPLSFQHNTGVWEAFVSGAFEGSFYKFDIERPDGIAIQKADPFARETELPPSTASRVNVSRFRFTDNDWIHARDTSVHTKKPISIYEVHLGSFIRNDDDNGRAYTYREIAPKLAAYVEEMGFTHVELLPVMEHPFGGSWGYQVSNYFAPTARYGTPDDFRYLVNFLHHRGIGVILDWVPAHFPKDIWALARFDGTALFEHLDPRQGEHPDWGTYVFNYARNEVRNFLVANAVYWIEEFHIDGLRVDAVASMLYLDYSRNDGEWIPNRYGGRENLDAIGFLRELNETIRARNPGAFMLAEESTSYPKVTSTVNDGGLGFHFKWNMGWMHDTLDYFSKDPISRHHHHNLLTFGMMYIYSEYFLSPLSHDEVVHLKGSLWMKMGGGTEDDKFANLRALYAYQWAFPGKKMLFMGGEIAQRTEWNHDRALDWHVLSDARHRGVQRVVKDLNRCLHEHPALSFSDHDPSGFSWLIVDDASANVIVFRRRAQDEREIIVACNFSGIKHEGYRVGLPFSGTYKELLNTDAHEYCGRGDGNCGQITAENTSAQGMPYSAYVTLPALCVIYFEAPLTADGVSSSG